MVCMEEKKRCKKYKRNSLPRKFRKKEEKNKEKGKHFFAKKGFNFFSFLVYETVTRFILFFVRVDFGPTNSYMW